MKNERIAAGTRWPQLSTNALSTGLGQFFERAGNLQGIAAPSMPASWADREDREASMDAHVRESIAWQVRVNREERGLKQRDLAVLAGTGQSAVSKIEDPDGGDVRLGSLLNVAHAFDCALLVRFVPYSEFAAFVSNPRPERLFACSYKAEREPMVRALLDLPQSVAVNE